MLSVSFTPDVGFLLCILFCFSTLGTKQRTEKQNKIHNKNPTSGVNDTDNIGNKTGNRKTKLFSVLFPMLSVSFTPDVGFLLCILFCFSVLCFVPNVVGVVHLRCGVLVVYFALFFCSLFCTENRKTKQNTQQEPHIRGERHRQHWEQNREQKNKTKYTTRTLHRG
jgi:cell division protein FtsW (lipid II flippase)